jgi:hypothetical protein
MRQASIGVPSQRRSAGTRNVPGSKRLAGIFQGSFRIISCWLPSALLRNYQLHITFMQVSIVNACLAVAIEFASGE